MFFVLIIWRSGAISRRLRRHSKSPVHGLRASIFRFGQSRTFVENIGWPGDWAGYVKHAGSLGRTGFRSTLDAYRARRPFGDKEHRRATDIAARLNQPSEAFWRPSRIDVL